MPRATETIADMIKLIGTLVERKHAYVAEDRCVYFSIKSFKDYGKLAHLDLENLQSGARVAHDEYDKEHAADFALWKAWDEDDGTIKWPSPWGDGRPGWHIECSTMSMKHLGETFDIHCGGEDLIFPHHEDEIAQSEAATGKPFVRYWLHNAHLLVEGRKMSKSAGNFYTLRDLLAKGWTRREVRYALISSHYRFPLNFTFEGLEAARGALARLDELLLKLEELSKIPASPLAAQAQPLKPLLELKTQFDAALDDDLNISGAIAALFDFIREINRRLAAGSLSPIHAREALEAWQDFDRVLGFGMPTEVIVPLDIQLLVAGRDAARKAKDFNRSDAIRDQLAKQGWVVEDTPKGPRAKRVG
jgi:cysteinyl-tRNA synthetase